MEKKNKNEKKQIPKVHPELEGFDYTINKFGEIVPTLDIDKINQFLDKHLNQTKRTKKKK
jgi:hypothetical protein